MTYAALAESAGPDPMRKIAITVAGAVVEVDALDPLRPGISVTANGVSLTVPPPILLKTLEFTEALEKMSKGELSASGFGKVRCAWIEGTLRRNYPDLPQAWFDELDVVEYQTLEDALQRASQQGEVTAGNP